MSRSLVDVRAAVPADAGALAALHARVFGSHDAAAVRPRVAAALARDDVEVQLALADGAVVGLLVLRLADPLAVVPGAAVHVEQLWVEPELRRRGVARSLLAAAARTAEQLGVEEIACSVPPSGREVHRFLARLGFGPAVTLRRVAVGRLKKHLVASLSGVDSTAARRRTALDQLVARRRQQMLTSGLRRAAGT